MFGGWRQLFFSSKFFNLPEFFGTAATRFAGCYEKTAGA